MRRGSGAIARRLRFAYHNHDFELVAMPGGAPLATFLGGTDRERVWFEMDVLERGRVAGIRHWFAEHDEPADPLAFAEASHAYLSSLP